MEENMRKFLTPGRILLLVVATVLGLFSILALASCNEAIQAAQTSGTTTVSDQPSADASTASWWTEAPDLPAAAWGDDAGGRQSYTRSEIAAGALGETPILNVAAGSIVGDAKLFVYAQKVNDDGTYGLLGHSFAVEVGDVYKVYVYGVNDAPGTVATGMRAALSVPIASVGGECHLVGTLSAENAEPKEVWSTLVLTGKTEFAISYRYGSAVLTNAAHDELPIGDELVTKAASENGILVGYEHMDGVLPGGEAYQFIVSVEIEIVEPTKSDAV